MSFPNNLRYRWQVRGNQTGDAMQYAMVDGTRREAFQGGRGKCPTCGSGMLSKCGSRVINHWAHEGRRDCDPWWENETNWHREWKKMFPEECREISHMAPDGEIHRADIRTPTGIYIEVQHSSMTDAERISRETFYKNLVWVIDGEPFRNNFDFYHKLPSPKADLAQDLVWHKAKRNMNGANAGLFHRVSANPGTSRTTTTGELVEIEGFHKIGDEVEASYCGHHQYDWVRPRKTWLDATCPVYIDFGSDCLWRLEVYDETGLECVRMVSKQDFMHDVMSVSSVSDIASGVDPFFS